MRAFVIMVVLCLCASSLHGQDSLEKGVHDLAVSLSVTMKNSSIKKIAVVEFTDLSGYPSVLGQFIAEELITEIFNVSPGQFDVVERRQLAKVLKEQKLAASGLVDSSTIANVGKLLGIQAIVIGSITDLGSEVKLNARLISVESAKVFAASSAKVTKDATAERLLHQGASADPSTFQVGDRQVPSRQRQASDVFFQNSFLRVDVKSFSVTKKGVVTIALALKNLTGQDLHLASNNGNMNCTAALVNDAGFSGNLRIDGLPCLHLDAKDKGDYVLISPASETTIVMNTRTFFDTPIPGNIFFLSLELIRLEGDETSLFTVGLANVESR